MRVFAQKTSLPQSSVSATHANLRLQPKLTLNTPGDIWEREADRVAEQVTKLNQLELRHAGRCAVESGMSHQAAAERLQIKSVHSNEITEIEVPPSVEEVLRSPGQPLDSTTRAFMEPRFGHDFSSVRVHRDERAANAAALIDARAFTAGRDIVFGAGEYAPDTQIGRMLLAHELAHVTQQVGNTIQRQGGAGGTQTSSAPAAQSWKAQIADWITGGAEQAHNVYNFFAGYMAQHPSLAALVNLEVDLASAAAGALIDTNPNTLGWVNLTNMWLFELGPTPIYFGANARTTKELQMQDGVGQVRALASAAAKKGNLSPVKQVWTYGQQAFYDGLKQGNLATSFLGSYNTKAFLTAGPNNTVILDLEVENVTSWESGTRLRKAATPGGSHQGIIPNRSRGGAGLHLGGNMTQYWNWSETLK
jgi:hypothetical protein